MTPQKYSLCPVNHSIPRTEPRGGPESRLNVFGEAPSFLVC